jgi:hypothetical protein
MVVRLDGDQIDLGFGEGGLALLAVESDLPFYFHDVGDIVELADGDLLIALRSDGPAPAPSVVKLSEEGAFDLSFGVDGYLRFDFAHDDGFVRSIVADERGFYGAGSASTSGGEDVLVFRATLQGEVLWAETFGGTWADGRPGSDYAWRVISDGRSGAYAMGVYDRQYGQEMMIARLEAGGIDRSFGSDGLLLLGNQINTAGAFAGVLDECGALLFTGALGASLPDGRVRQDGVVLRVLPLR